MICTFHKLIAVAFGVAMCLLTAPVLGINVHVDYTYDTSHFFGIGNPKGPLAGAQARASLEAAAQLFSSILNDTFAPIAAPPAYHSSISDGAVNWTWTQVFEHPSTGATVQVTNPMVAADEYRIYAGARNLPGTTLATGGPGGFGWMAQVSGTNSFSATDIDNINQITNSFNSAVERRGEPDGFARWGGTIAFDTQPVAMWHYDHTTEPPGNAKDFSSIAIHELAHALGFGGRSSGVATEWQSQVSGSQFVGPRSIQEYGSPVPLASDLAHWADGTSSVVVGSTVQQEVALAGIGLESGTRKRFTQLDAAGLADIGWDVSLPVVPEPATINVVWAAGLFLALRRARSVQQVL